ncbi:MAG: peroxiredoxin [Saprospiraceae bacterium]|nr:peroxiredoxin [Saprospiraceae bacterium]
MGQCRTGFFAHHACRLFRRQKWICRSASRQPKRYIQHCFLQNDAKFNEEGLSAFVFAWGQFIDHDISVTEEGDERANILLPNNEPLFRTPISFSRSKPRSGTGVNSPREQTNKITAWIDGSVVYGSDMNRANWLRTFRNGKLKVSSGNLLPFNTVNGQQSGAVDPNAPHMAGDNRGKVFVAGDERANEQPTLMALHTLFVREHNRICDNFVRLGYTNDENNYQLARKIVAAHIQAITFEEFLPALGIELDYYEGCNQNLNPNTLHEFASAGFRIGHTMVNPALRLVDNNNRTTGTISLVQGFFNTDFVKNRGIDQILMGMSRDRQQEIDLLVINDLRNFLFASQPGSPGTDLVSINIQRGRDHGLADYNTVRKTFTGSRVNTWSDITKNRTVQDKLRQLYPSVNDIDLWVGALAEDKLSWASVGITHYAILWTQFTILRDGDRFYFENDPLFDEDWHDYFFETTLGDLIRFNTGLSNIGWDVFLYLSTTTLERMICLPTKKPKTEPSTTSILKQ